MRQVVLQMGVTLDGYVARRGGEGNWGLPAAAHRAAHRDLNPSHRRRRADLPAERHACPRTCSDRRAAATLS